MGSLSAMKGGTATTGPSGYYPIPTAMLTPTARLTVDLYLSPGEGKAPVLYRECEYPLSTEDIDRLAESSLRNLYVSAGQLSQYQCYLRENLKAFLENETLPPVERFSVLQDVACDLLREAFTSNNTGVIVDESARLSGGIVDLVCRRELVALELFRVMHHDYETFHHAVNVASYCALLAHRLGIRRREELEAITTGGLLHDLGKRHIPFSILSKCGLLNESERAVIRSHPQAGFEELCHRDDLDWGQLMMVFQHHERLDGRGYPMRMVGNDIHEWGRLCAVVDVFDAMSSTRRYKRALPWAEVLDYLERHAGIGFDGEMVECWKATILPTR